MSRLLGALMRLPAAKDIRVHKGPRQIYTNVDVLTSSVGKLWDALSQVVRRDRTLRQSAIVACEGKHGWDDYELVYHFDPEQIDQKWRQRLPKPLPAPDL